MTAREEVLARVRAAIGASRELQVQRDYRTAGSAAAHGDLLDLLHERLEDYRAGVHRCAAVDAGVAAAVGAALARRAAGPPHGRPRVAVPPGLPREWLAALDVEVLVDEGTLGAEDLDTVDVALTGAALAVAETGTIVLDGSPDQGRRILTLVPDVHVCVVRRDQVVASVPDAVAALDPCRPQTWVSGPSATSDIELNRVEGVHGPRTLEVVLLD